MYIQLLFCPIRVEAQGLTFFPFVQFNISAQGYLYCCDAKGTCEIYKIYDPVNLSVLGVFNVNTMNFSVVRIKCGKDS